MDGVAAVPNSDESANAIHPYMADANPIRRPILVGPRCPWCDEQYNPHPGFADHRDECPRRPMHQPHINGTGSAGMRRRDYSEVLQE